MFWPTALFVVIHVLFVSAVNPCNDTVSLLGPMLCIACYDSCLAAVVHGLGYT